MSKQLTININKSNEAKSNNKSNGLATVDKPIYCRTCQKSATWQPYDRANILSADNAGKVIWQGFKCSGCNSTTIRLTSEGVK